MIIPKTKAAWKRLQPTHIKQAFRYCKEYARQHERLTVPAIAELMGKSDDLLYKWLSNGSMPSHLVAMYERICGIDYVTQYQAYRSHKLLIDIPMGKKPSDVDFNDLQLTVSDALNLLVHFYKEDTGLDGTVEAITKALTGLAFHQKNIVTQHELDLFEGDDDE